MLLSEHDASERAKQQTFQTGGLRVFMFIPRAAFRALQEEVVKTELEITKLAMHDTRKALDAARCKP